METNSNKKINPVDYEGDMARLCEKIRTGNDDYEFSIKEHVRNSLKEYPSAKVRVPSIS